MTQALYLFGGPLIWLANVALLAMIGARGCAPSSLVLAIQLAALAGCVALLYRALSRVRSPANAGNDSARLRHFVAGGITVLSMAAIGATAFSATLSASC